MGETGSHKDEEKTHQGSGLLSSNKLFYVLAIATFAVLALNQMQISSLNSGDKTIPTVHGTSKRNWLKSKTS